MNVRTQSASCWPINHDRNRLSRNQGLYQIHKSQNAVRNVVTSPSRKYQTHNLPHLLRGNRYG